MSTGLALLLLAGGVVWLAAGIAIALITGRVIRRADEIARWHLTDPDRIDFNFPTTTSDAQRVQGRRASTTNPL